MIEKKKVKIGTEFIPISVQYADKMELAYRLLDLYDILVQDLNPRNKDILACALVLDVNSPTFKKTIISMIKGVNNDKHITVELSRLKKKGLIYPHQKYNRKLLNPAMQSFKDLIESGAEDVSIVLNFIK